VNGNKINKEIIETENARLWVLGNSPTTITTRLARMHMKFTPFRRRRRWLSGRPEKCSVIKEI